MSSPSTNTLLNSARGFIIAIAIAALLVIGLLVGRSWLSARDAVTQLTATIASQKKIIDQATQQEEQRDAATAKAVKSITRAKAEVKTPADAAAQIPLVLPPLPEPLQVNLPEPTPDDPTPPATATVPEADLQPIYDDIQDCRICQTKLAAATQDLADERAKESALTAERNAAIKATHGGTFWTQLKSSAKWLLLGAAAGALAAKTIHNQPH